MKAGKYWINAKGKTISLAEKGHMTYLLSIDDNFPGYKEYSAKMSKKHRNWQLSDNTEEIMQLVFNQGWIRVWRLPNSIMAQYEKEKVSPQALQTLVDDVMDSIKTLKRFGADFETSDSPSGTSPLYNFEKEEDKEEFFKDYRRYLK